MNLSMKWLKEFVTLDDMPMRSFTEAMTMSGSKVEGYEVEGSEISNVVVARVESMERHPDSDHLWICQVNVGAEENIQIVTGAQNLKPGDVPSNALVTDTTFIFSNCSFFITSAAPVKLDFLAVP